MGSAEEVRAAEAARDDFLKTRRPGSMGAVCARILFDALIEDLREGKPIDGRHGFTRGELLAAMEANPAWEGKQFERTSFNSVPEELGRQLREFVFDGESGANLRIFGPTRRYRKFETASANLFLEIETGAKADAGRRKWPAVAAAAFIVAAVAIFVSQTKRETISGPAVSARQITHDGTIESAAITPDGKFIVWSAGGRELLLRLTQISTMSDVELLRLPLIPGDVSISPDGEHIYFQSRKESERTFTLYRIPLLGGPPLKITAGLSTLHGSSPIAFSPDSEQFVFVRDSERFGTTALWVRDVTKGIERVLYQPDGAAWAPSWSPDGRAIASTILTTDFDLDGFVVIDPSSGIVKNRVTGKLASSIWIDDTSVVGRTISGEGGQIFVVNAQTGARRPVTDDLNVYTKITATRPRDKFAVVRRQVLNSIWVKDVSAGAMRQVTAETGNGAGINGLTWRGNEEIVFATQHRQDISCWSLALARQLRRPFRCPSGTRAIYVAANGRIMFAVDADGAAHVMVAAAEEEPIKTIVKARGIGALSLTPDRQNVIYTNRGPGDPGTFTVPIDGGQREKILEQRCNGATLSPDETRFACWLSAPDMTAPFTEGVSIPFGGVPVVVVDGASGRTTHSFNLNTDFFSWTPDGEGLAYVRDEDDAANVWVQPLNGDSYRLTAFPSGRVVNFAWSPDGRRLAVARLVMEHDVVLLDLPIP